MNKKSKSSCLSSLVHSPSIQAKLTVGKPDDGFEKEANDTAAKVMTSPLLVFRRKKGEEMAQTKPVIQKQPEEEEEETAQTKPLIQKQPEEEEEETAQTKPLIQKQPEEEEEVRTKGGAVSDTAQKTKSFLLAILDERKKGPFTESDFATRMAKAHTE